MSVDRSNGRSIEIININIMNYILYYILFSHKKKYLNNLDIDLTALEFIMLEVD